METRRWYRWFGEVEAGRVSPTYERLGRAVAGDAVLVERLDALPKWKRQPNLLFGVTRYLGGPVEDPDASRAWVLAHWDRVVAEMSRRSTQTNEAGRCAPLLPLLAALPQPLALLEVGTSAGLCLYPDRYAYDFGGHRLGTGPVTLTCAVAGPVPLPSELPTVVWRAGLDLNPLDPGSAEDLRWLEALVWPEQEHRRRRLRAAAAVAASEPPLVVRGDLRTDLPDLAARAPADATLVIMHTAVLAYLEPAEREAFARTVTKLPGHWISNEGGAVFPWQSEAAGLPPETAARFVLALDDRAVALSEPHGASLTWLETNGV
ncbi:DUF2332 domain-containing protein [Virgisporangium aliadipatigenens]|nr:DUF2332 domain-containing protein [Virgisporangium aliadipatigenens]